MFHKPKYFIRRVKNSFRATCGPRAGRCPGLLCPIQLMSRQKHFVLVTTTCNINKVFALKNLPVGHEEGCQKFSKNA